MKTRSNARISPLRLVQDAGLLRSVFAPVALALAVTPGAMARGPTGGQVASGSATIRQQGATTTITASNGAIINYQSFNIAAGETVRFVQPDASSRVLNRVTGPDPSRIAGSLIANGIVYIVNPAGVYFAQGSLVNVGGLYAAAGKITNADFLANVNHFTGVRGTVENSGTINAGAAHLVGARVANYGAINAPEGIVTMTAGEDVYVGTQGGQIFARVDRSSGGSVGVAQAGEINAPRGRVALGAGDMYAMAIDHPGRTTAKDISLRGGRTGVVSVSGTLDASATGAGQKGGKVEVLGDKVGLFGGGTINASGPAGGGTVHFGGDYQGQGTTRRADAAYVAPTASIFADATWNGNGGTVIVWSDRYTNFQGRISARGGTHGGDGGLVETSGKIDLFMTGSVTASAARGRAGLWLLDPTDVTLSNNPTSNGALVAGVFTPAPVASANVDLADILTALNGGTSVQITTASAGAGNGDITLVDPLNANLAGGAVTLTLNAVRDIVINAGITDTSAAGNELSLQFLAGRDTSINSAITLNGGALSVVTGRNAIVGATVATANGNIALGAASQIQLGANLDAGTGDIAINDPAVLLGNVTLSGNDVTFASTLDSSGAARDLTINTSGSGSTRFSGAIGNATPLGTLTTNADGTTRINTAAVTLATADFNDAVILESSTLIIATTGATFASTIDSEANESNDLLVTSPVTVFQGVVGGAAANTYLGTLSTDPTGTTTIDTSAITAEFLDFNDPVVIATDTVVKGSTMVAFNNTVDSEATEANNLTINSPDTLLFGSVGVAAADTFLGTLITNPNGTTTIEAPNITAEVLDFRDDIIIGADTIVKGSTSVSFAKTINSDAGEANDLTVNSPLTIFNGVIGGAASTTFLGTLITNPNGTTTINTTAITAEVLDFRDDIVIGVDTVVKGSTSVSFAKTINSEGNEANDLIVNSPLTTFNGVIGGAAPNTFLGTLLTNPNGTTTINTSAITAAVLDFRDDVILGVDTVVKGSTSVAFGKTVNSQSSEANDLTVNSPLTTFRGEVGTGAGGTLGTLVTNPNGRTIIEAGRITAADIDFRDAITIGADTIVTGTSSVRFGSTLGSASGQANDLTITSPLTTFDGEVGINPGAALGLLATDAAGTTTINGGAMTAARLDFGDSVVLGADTTLTGSTAVRLLKTVNSEAGEENDLTVIAPTTVFNGQVGMAANGQLGTLNTDSGSGHVTTLATGRMRARRFEFEDAVRIAFDLRLDALDQATFESTVDSRTGAFDLTINSPTTVFNGSVGAGTNGALGALMTDSAGTTVLNAAAFNAATLSFADAVQLNANVTITGTTSVSFASTIDSGTVPDRALTINSPTTVFDGAIGTGSGGTLRALTTDAAGTTSLNGGTLNVSDLELNDAVVLGADTTVTGTEARFGGALDSGAGQTFDLTVNGDDTTFAGIVGGATGGRLGAIVTNAAGRTTYAAAVSAQSITANDRAIINGGSMNTTGDQAYNASVSIGANLTVAGANVNFAGAVDSGSADRSLTVNTTGNGVTRFGGAIGQNAPLSSLTTNLDGTTVLAGGTIITSGDINFADPVTLAATNNLSGNDVTFSNTLNSDGTARSLTVNTSGGGITFFNAGIGGTSALNALTTNSDGTTRLNGGFINATGRVSFNDATSLGENTTITASDISFGGTLRSEGLNRHLTLNTSGNGATTFIGAVGGTTTLDALASITTNADGRTVFFSPTIRSTGDQTYGDNVEINAQTTLSANDVAFLGTINSRPLSTNAGLTVNLSTNGTATFLGDVGATTPLRTFATNSVGSTRVAGDITTTGSMTFGNALIMLDDATFRDAGTSGISFASTINSDGTARSLSLLIDPASNATAAAPAIASITFGGDVGGNSALRSLTLGSNRTTTPTAATIAAGRGSGGAPISNFSLTITTTGDFTMAQRQKLTVAGDLTINAGGVATLGDISTLRSMTVNSPSIVLQSRPASAVLVSSGSGAVATGADVGTDFVAGSTITFSSTPTVTGGFARPAFATPDATGISSNLATFQQQAVGTVSATQVVTGDGVFDLRATGPSNAPVSEALAGALPTERQLGVIANDTAVGRAEREQLAELGIHARTPEQEELLSFLVGRALYQDLTPSLGASEAEVNVNRLPSAAVARVLATYREVLMKSTVDPTTGEVTRSLRAERIREVVGAAWNEYSAAAGSKADALGFRAYVEAVDTHAEAMASMNGLRRLFTELGFLGLSPAELRISKNSVLRAVTPPGMPMDQFEAAIVATRLGSAR
ncbi:MAG: filamentous hemagglutinin N-terminal domain-containing protein [Phycisphaerae bacterium]|nr:filamentous hemagglutinin N-terminal domain-containing protein [Phycisphaerae bacterium]